MDVTGWGVLIQILSLIVAGVLGINAIKTTTAVLNETIKSLKLTIDDLKLTIREIRNEQTDHGHRLAVLEAKNG